MVYEGVNYVGRVYRWAMVADALIYVMMAAWRLQTQVNPYRLAQLISAPQLLRILPNAYRTCTPGGLGYRCAS